MILEFHSRKHSMVFHWPLSPPNITLTHSTPANIKRLDWLGPLCTANFTKIFDEGMSYLLCTARGEYCPWVVDLSWQKLCHHVHLYGRGHLSVESVGWSQQHLFHTSGNHYQPASTDKIYFELISRHYILYLNFNPLSSEFKSAWGQGLVVQNHKIHIIPNSVVKLNDYVMSFSYSIQNYVSD
jgi:hypothetical protein